MTFPILIGICIGIFVGCLVFIAVMLPKIEKVLYQIRDEISDMRDHY